MKLYLSPQCAAHLYIFLTRNGQIARKWGSQSGVTDTASRWWLLHCPAGVVWSRLMQDSCPTSGRPEGCCGPVLHNTVPRLLPGKLSGLRGASSLGCGPSGRSPSNDWLQWSGSTSGPWEQEEAVAGQERHWPHKWALRIKRMPRAGEMETPSCSSLRFQKGT